MKLRFEVTVVYVHVGIPNYENHLSVHKGQKVYKSSFKTFFSLISERYTVYQNQTNMLLINIGVIYIYFLETAKSLIDFPTTLS